MCVDDSLADRKPQSDTRDCGVGGVAGTEEAIEQLIDVSFRDPDTRVGDLQHSAASIVPVPAAAAITVRRDDAPWRRSARACGLTHRLSARPSAS